MNPLDRLPWPKAAPPLRDHEELLDAGHGSLAQVRQSLADITRINTYLGGLAPVEDALWPLLRQNNLQQATVLDIGTGGADIPLHLIRRARHCGIQIHVIGADVNTRHLHIARENRARQNNGALSLVQGDAFSLPLADGSVDVVLATLFLHHFRPREINALLTEMSRVARVGWIINDIERAYVPLWFFRMVRPIFARSYLTRHDGEASLRRTYTAAEWREIFRSVPGARVEEFFPYRVRAVWTRGSA